MGGKKNGGALVHGHSLHRVDLREEVCALEAAGTHTGPGHDGLLQWAHNPGRLNGVYAVKGAEGGRKGCSFEQADIDALNLAGISKLCGFSAECKNMKHWHYMKKNNNALRAQLDDTVVPELFNLKAISVKLNQSTQS